MIESIPIGPPHWVFVVLKCFEMLLIMPLISSQFFVYSANYHFVSQADSTLLRGRGRHGFFFSIFSDKSNLKQATVFLNMRTKMNSEVEHKFLISIFF